MPVWSSDERLSLESGASDPDGARMDFRAAAGAARHSTRLRAFAAAVLCAGLLAACSSDSDADSSPGDADASPIAAESAGAEGAPDSEGGDEAAGDAGQDEAEPAGDGAASGTATWAGETYAYDSIMCQDQSQFGQFNMIANGPDAPTLTVQIEFNPLEEPDYSQPSKVELFFEGEGGTVGDGEGYAAPYGPVEGATSSMDGASGSVQLEPDESTRAPELNPEGGQLDFEITCG